MKKDSRGKGELRMKALKVVAVAAAISLAGFGAERESVSLATADGVKWEAAVADTLDLRATPEGLAWAAAELPTTWKGPTREMKSVDGKYAYSTAPIKNYFGADGKFKVQKSRSCFFRAKVNVDGAMLKGRTVHLTAERIGYKAGVIVNGKPAGESVQSCLPQDFDVTGLIREGENEITVAFTVREGLVDEEGKFYRAPSNGGELGVRGPVLLEFRPAVRIEDVWVKTGVREKRFEVEVEVTNATARAFAGGVRVKVSPEAAARVGSTELRAEVEVPAGESRRVKMANGWVAPVLWCPETPALYAARVELTGAGGAREDEVRKTFGYREVWVKGKDVMLNNVRRVFIRNSTLEGVGSLDTAAEMRSSMEVNRRSHQVNSIRQHLGTLNASMLDAADRNGMMMMVESAYSWKHCFPPEDSEKWLPGVLEYFRRWVKAFRTSASVLVYNLTNETVWESTDDMDMAIGKKIVAAVRETDPTRLLAGDGDNDWGKQLDVTNIHYPEGQGGTVRLKYPNSSIVAPNDFGWLTEKGGDGWRTKFEWDRPLMLGEFGMGLRDDDYSSVAGDSYYRWTEWEGREMGERSVGTYWRSETNPFMEHLKKSIVHLRAKGVAGLNPWGGEFRHVIKMTAVAPLDYHLNAGAGEKFVRKVAVFNDGNDGVPVNGVRWVVKVGGAPVTNGVLRTHAGVGIWRTFEVGFEAPETDGIEDAEMDVSIFWQRGREEIRLDGFRETVKIYPKRDLSGLAGKVGVLDPGKTLEGALAGMGLKAGKTKGKKTMLVVGRDALTAKMTARLDKFAEAGGTVLVMPQKEWKPWRTEAPERDPLHACSQGWIRMGGHPAMKGLNDASASWWRHAAGGAGKKVRATVGAGNEVEWDADNMVSYGTFFKPAQGPVKPLVDAGGRFGMQWSPLLEVPVGEGRYIFTTLELDCGDAAANEILARLIKYGAAAGKTPRAALNVVCGDNAELREALEMAGAVTAEGVGEAGPVLVDASAGEVPEKELKAALAAGRKVWLHGFGGGNAERVKGLLPDGVGFAKNAAPGAEVVGGGAATGLASFDLAWYRRTYMPNKGLFEKATPMAELGEWAVEAPWHRKGCRRLAAPAVMAEFDAGAGTLLVDTLKLEAAAAKEPQKAMRVTCAILTNLGVEFKFGAKAEYSYRPLDISAAVNMDYIDETAGDGKGGWIDAGRCDMRFFLTNHAGTGDGEIGGMAVDTDRFPTSVRFNGIPFQLIDPKSNRGRAVATFGSAKFPLLKMRKAGPFAVGGKVDGIWALHATGWGADGKPAAEWTFRYKGGETAKVVLVNGRDVGDWYQPKQLAKCKIAWSGRNLEANSVGVYQTLIANPKPELEVESVEVAAGFGDCLYVLLGATAAARAAEGEGGVCGRAVTHFRMDFAEGVPEQKHPKPGRKVEGGLGLEHGESFWIVGGKGMKDAARNPVGLALEFTPQAEPDGYCAGLFETGAFRVTLTRSSMKVVMEGWGADGKRVYMESREPVVLGKRVRFEIVLDGKRCRMWRDGKLDTMAEMGLRDADFQGARLGLAGGQNYFFNGVFHLVEMYAPELK